MDTAYYWCSGLQQLIDTHYPTLPNLLLQVTIHCNQLLNSFPVELAFLDRGVSMLPQIIINSKEIADFIYVLVSLSKS